MELKENGPAGKVTLTEAETVIHTLDWSFSERPFQHLAEVLLGQRPHQDDVASMLLLNLRNQRVLGSDPSCGDSRVVVIFAEREVQAHLEVRKPGMFLGNKKGQVVGR